MCQHPRRIPAPFKWVRPTQLIGISLFSAFPYPFAWSFPAFLGVGVFLFPFPTLLCPFLVVSRPFPAIDHWRGSAGPCWPLAGSSWPVPALYPSGPISLSPLPHSPILADNRGVVTLPT